MIFIFFIITRKNIITMLMKPSSSSSSMMRMLTSRSDYLWCIRDLWFFELGRKYSSRAKASNEKKRVFSAVYAVNTYGQ